MSNHAFARRAGGNVYATAVDDEQTPERADRVPVTAAAPLDLARPARLASVGKIIVSAGYLLALFTVAGRFPQLYAGIIFVPAAALAIPRHLRVLSLRPRLRATGLGLTVRIWHTYFLVPWVFEQERTIAWADLTGATVHTLRTNGLATSSLVLAYKGGSLEIEPGVFAENASELQRRILDRHERGKEGPGVAKLPAAEAVFRRRDADASAGAGGARPGHRDRFTTPITIESSVARGAAAIPAAITVAVVAGGALFAPEIWFVWANFAAIPLIFALAMWASSAQRRRVRLIVLRREALAIGPSPDELAPYPWDQIAYAMLSTTNGTPTSVRVVLHDGREIVLHGKYDRSLPEICELVDPRR